MDKSKVKPKVKPKALQLNYQLKKTAAKIQ